MDALRTYFNYSDFECKCGCGRNEAKPELIHKLNEARRAAGVPFHITSGTRCESNNAASGGSPDSAHVDGWAADIQCNSSRPRYKMIMGLSDAGFTRIGISNRFTHVDCDPDKPKSVIWVY